MAERSDSSAYGLGDSALLQQFRHVLQNLMKGGENRFDVPPGYGDDSNYPEQREQLYLHYGGVLPIPDDL